MQDSVKRQQGSRDGVGAFLSQQLLARGEGNPLQVTSATGLADVSVWHGADILPPSWALGQPGVKAEAAVTPWGGLRSQHRPGVLAPALPASVALCLQP